MKNALLIFDRMLESISEWRNNVWNFPIYLPPNAYQTGLDIFRRLTQQNKLMADRKLVLLFKFLTYTSKFSMDDLMFIKRATKYLEMSMWGENHLEHFSDILSLVF